MSFLSAPRILDRDPCDYNVQYLQKLKRSKDSLVETVQPKDWHKFVPMLSALSQYLESGYIMLIYKEMPDHDDHLNRTMKVNICHAIKFNKELETLKEILSIEQTMICNEMALTILRGC